VRACLDDMIWESVGGRKVVQHHWMVGPVSDMKVRWLRGLLEFGPHPGPTPRSLVLVLQDKKAKRTQDGQRKQGKDEQGYLHGLGGLPF
jgi:hypothetical protein